jgi:hypothetical protein
MYNYFISEPIHRFAEFSALPKKNELFLYAINSESKNEGMWDHISVFSLQPWHNVMINLVKSKPIVLCFKPYMVV